MAGQSTSCSQKIHNLLVGQAASDPASEYCLFLDDDVELHGACLGQLVDTMQQEPSLFMATGYPLDVPPAGSSFWAYCAMIYHLPLLIGFSVRQRTSFVWGGCMMLRRPSLTPEGDHHGLLKAWRDGGYSDDLLLAAMCTEHKLGIAVPSFALFPQWLDARMPFRSYWNYLRRQLFVLDTYSNAHNRVLNHFMAAFHVWASTALAAGLLSATWHLAGVLLQVPAYGSHAPPATHPVPQSAVACLLALCFAHASLRFMIGEAVELLVTLAPHRRAELRTSLYEWHKVWAALLVESLLLPACMAYTMVAPHIVWGGVRYHKRGGRVSRAACL